MDKLIKQKAFGIVGACLIFFAYAGLVLFNTAFNKSYLEAAQVQGKYQVTLEKSRGIIYDCNLVPLTNTDLSLYALSPPTPSALLSLKDTTQEELDMETTVKEGLPFLTKVNRETDNNEIEYMMLSQRYSENMLCTNLLGYVDSNNKGVDGIEKVFDDILSKDEGSITVRYTADALGRLIAGDGMEIDNTIKTNKSGVALTIDSEIQTLVESAAQSIEKGAVVVLDCKTSEIKAMVSLPSYNPLNLEESLTSDDAPMINRCLTAYAPGSVFKLTLAAAALGTDIDYKTKYLCTGSTLSDGLEFNCYGGQSHGLVNLHTALQKSCNCYFINLAKNLSPEDMLTAAKKLGLGTQTELYDGYYGNSGSLTSEQNLLNIRARSNYAIGQGDVLVTPIQAAAMVNAIANNGIYKEPKIYEGEVSEEGEISKWAEGTSSVSAMEEFVALRLKSYMESTVKYGTAKSVFSELYTAGAKTGTAETGYFEGDTPLVNYWFCGYIGQSSPEYVIVVMSESTKTGDNTTQQVFKEIADEIYR